MIKEILQKDNPLLREKSQTVSKEELNSKEMIQLKEDLLDTLMGQRLGVGISAVQIGVLKAVSLVYIKARPNRPDLKPYGPIYFFNLKVVGQSPKEVVMNEGCLSVDAADLFGDVKRAESVTLEYMDENGEITKRKFKGFKARLLQHEIGHLNGELFIDIVDKSTLRTEKEYIDSKS